jgi:hypothetical protein
VNIKQDNTSLVHIMMPCYFNDISPLILSGSITYEMVYQFLLASANFYKHLYYKLGQELEINIYILIPHIDYFKQLIESEEHAVIYSDIQKDNRAQSIIDVINNEIISKIGRSHLYVLVNQNVEELKPVVKALYSLGTCSAHLGIVELPIYAGLSRTNIFTPYILKREKEYKDSKTSPLVTPEILKYFVGERHE